MNIESNTDSFNGSRGEKPEKRPLTGEATVRERLILIRRRFWDALQGKAFCKCLAGGLAVVLLSSCANCGGCHAGGGSDSGGARSGASGGAQGAGGGACCSKPMESGYKK